MDQQLNNTIERVMSLERQAANTLKHPDAKDLVQHGPQVQQACINMENAIKDVLTAMRLARKLQNNNRPGFLKRKKEAGL